SWDVGAAPSVSVVVATYGRSGYLGDLLAAFEDQDLPTDDFEVILVDNGSGDDTWPVLAGLAARSPLRLLALHLDQNQGPGGGRNRGAAHARGRVVAITDDDCLPTPVWVREVRDAFDDRTVSVLQGRVEPPARDQADAAPWDH